MIKAVIIDDEPKARQGLHLAIKKYCPDIEILSLCDSPEMGLKKINELEPDLVFLDVQMPKMSGFDLLDKIDEINFDVVFVTAHDKYAIKAIKFSALDYLLKPIDIDELVSAVQKISKKKENTKIKYQSLLSNVNETSKATSKAKAISRLAIPTENEIILQPIMDIIYCEADSSYTTLHLINDKKITVAKTLKEFENMLPEIEFCRIHHSTLVNMSHVLKYVKGEGGYIIVSNNAQLNVSRRKKDYFLHLLHES